MSAVYRVIVQLPNKTIGTVIVKADDRAQAKARALLQVRSMGHRVHDDAVCLCRKESKPTVFGNWPVTPIGGKGA